LDTTWLMKRLRQFFAVSESKVMIFAPPALAWLSAEQTAFGSLAAMAITLIFFWVRVLM
jgi:hypothetical protein